MGSQWSQGCLVEFSGRNAENKWAVYIGRDVNQIDYVVYLSGGAVRLAGLNDVAGGKEYKVNNKYDGLVDPLPPSQIAANAKREVGNWYPNLGAEKFAALMRYGPSSEALFTDVGDIIKFETHPFWAVYLGHGVMVYYDTQVQTRFFFVKSGYKVNNQYDDNMQTRTPEEIVAKAIEEKDKIYSSYQASPESFASNLRYGISLEGPFPKAGDMIEYLRGLYQHWAVYDCNALVIHLTGTGIEALSLSASQAVAGSSAIESTAEIKYDHMEDVGNGSRYRVNNKYDKGKKPFSPAEIVRNAKRKVGQQRWYHAMRANCEHFATECRYGEGICGQVADVVAKVAAGGVAAGAGLYLSGSLVRML